MNKREFYPTVEDLFVSYGYRYYPEEKIKGLGKGGARKPDFVATNSEVFIIGEIKSPAELPESSSWRSIQPYDSQEMREIRVKVKNLERSGQVSPKVGGHAIIIFGQLREYLNLMGERWRPPENPGGLVLLLAYAYPKEWSDSVIQALRTFDLNPVQHLKGDVAEAIVFAPSYLQGGIGERR